jgi:hypothetical protein
MLMAAYLPPSCIVLSLSLLVLAQSAPLRATA